jgi:hypothetical protein
MLQKRLESTNTQTMLAGTKKDISQKGILLFFFRGANYGRRSARFRGKGGSFRYLVNKGDEGNVKKGHKMMFN